ncbi:ABC transporter ATP-binding protein [Georgenia faecalis]|uniref:ABC transporter ATP-binding protein n=1 Tax=Georgenia faecalis TaxID=2483799 RepID=A0ABV9D8H4_9MICO|nr:ABC transporter ATP-binding protein [Georgenia faecalis]
MHTDTRDRLAPAPTALALRLEGVTKTYGTSSRPVPALRGVDLAIPTGSFTAVMGPSGSGKSTLLHCAAGLDRPTAGRIVLGATEITTLARTALTRFRRDHLGFVFQSYNLLPHLTVAQNITLPLLLAGRPVDAAWFDAVTRAVGLADLTARRPQELSGGQQQRAAIARALINRPDAVFCDEPTGALDSRTGRQVLELLRRTAGELGQTVVMVTHDPVAASYADRVLFLADGQLVGSLDAPDAQGIADRMTHLGEW